MGPKRRRVVSEKVKKARKAINKKANQGGEEPLVLDGDAEALRWRFVEWEGIPPDSRDLVVTFLSVKDNMLGLNNAMTNKKGDLRNQLVASYKDAIIPAWHTYPFRNPKGMFSNDGFKELHKVLDMGIDLQTVNLIVWSSSESRETSHPDKVLLQLVQGENDQQKLAELYATKWSPSKDRNLPSGDDENENESENQNGDGGEGGEAIDVASIQQTLYAATAKRYLVVMKALLKRGADVNADSDHGSMPPLHLAADNGHVDVAKVLLEHGADIHKTWDNGRTQKFTPLILASKKGHLGAVKILVEAADEKRKKYNKYVDKATSIPQIAPPNPNGNPPAEPLPPKGDTALCLASLHGYTNVVEYLIGAGADVNKHADNSDSPVQAAVKGPNPKIVRMLLQSGAKANPPLSSEGKSPLYQATEKACGTRNVEKKAAYEEIVYILISAGANIDRAATNSNGSNPLLFTARHDNVAVMRALLDAGANVDAALGSGETSLFRTSSRGNVEQARMLLEKGADIDRPNDKQATPLYIAAQNGHVEVMQLLVEKGANINPPVCSEGKTLLYVATEGACKGTDDEATMIVYVELLDILIKGADDIDQAATGNNNGCNPLLMTAGYGNVAMMRALLDAGATVDRALNSGETSLFRASSGGNVEQVRMLLEKGADIDRPNETLTTPLYIAAQNGHLEAMRLLVERGLSDAAAAGYDQITGIDNAPDGTNGKTPLYAALERGHMEVGKLLIERGGADTTVTVKGQSLEQASTKMEIVVMLRLTERDRDLAVIAAALSTDTAAVADEIKRDDEVAEAEKDAKKAEEEAKAAGAAAAGAAAGGSAPAPAPPMSTPSSASAEAEAKTDQEVADDMDDEEDEDYNPDEDDEEDEEGDSDSDSADYLPEVVVARQQGNLSELESVSLQGVDGDTDQTAYEAGILAAGGTTSMDPGSAPAPTPPTSPPPSASAGRGRPSHTRSRKSDGTFCAAAPVTRRARRMSPGAGTTDVPAVPDAATLANRKVLKEATLRRRERQREDAFLEEQYQYYTLADGRQTQQVGNYWAQTVAGVEAASPANEFRPTHWYMSRQRDINSRMRAILFDWMTEVIQRTRYFDTNKLKRRDSERLALHPAQRVEETNVLHLSVNLTDRYLTRVVIKRSKLQLVGVVAMKIAFNALMDDICAWDVHDWLTITDNAYSRSEVVELEFQMLTALEYNVFDGLEKFRPFPDADPWAEKPYYLPFSIPAYLHQYLLAVNAVDTTLGTLAHYYAEKSIHKSEICLAHPPQHIAAAALFAASILQCQMPSHFETAAPFHWKKQPVTRVLLRKCWTETHQEVTGLTVNPGDASLSNVLVELASEMVRYVDKTTVTASKRTLDACKKRYGDYSRLGQDVIKGVSGMPIPDLSSLVAWASLMRQERP